MSQDKVKLIHMQSQVHNALKNESFQMYRGYGGTYKAEPFNDILSLSVTASLSTGSGRVVAVWLPENDVLTGIRWPQSIAGVYTSNNYSGVGLYTYSAGVATLVASSTNDANLLTSGGGWKQKDFSSTYTATAGLYFAAIIFNASSTTTLPTLAVPAVLQTNTLSVNFPNSGKLVGVFSSTTMPTTITFSAITTSTSAFYLQVY